MATLTRDLLTPHQETLARTCVHEAAHALVATIYGGRITAAAVSGGNAHGEITGHTGFAVLPAGYDAQITFAGPYAAARWQHNRRPTQAEVWAQMGSGCGSDAALLADAGGSYLGAEAIPLVDWCFGSVCKLAGVIAKRTVARHSDVTAALGLSDDPQIAAHQLALIRSGSRPDSFRVTVPA